MDKFLIDGGNKVSGKVNISSAKNALLPIISACVAVGRECFLEEFPNYSDTNTMLEIIGKMGGKYCYRDGGVAIDTSGLKTGVFPAELFGKIRASVFMLGAVLSRMGRAEAVLPGGCNIGDRPIDIHLSGLAAMGARVERQGDRLVCTCDKLKGANVKLPFPSVGATENLIITASLAEGKTVLKNAAREPEIKDLADFLTQCGAKIYGAGTSTVTVVGVKALHGTAYKAIPDRIEAATYLLGTLLLGGECEINGCGMKNILAIINKTEHSACKICTFSDKIYIKAYGNPKAVGCIAAGPYPAFPTDAQAQAVAMLSVADGVSTLRDDVFPSRFGYVSEMNKLGADIRVTDNLATVNGVRALHGAEVTAMDLRGGVGLILAGLKAEGQSVVNGACHIDRGYDGLEGKLSGLGLKIKRIR